MTIRPTTSILLLAVATMLAGCEEAKQAMNDAIDTATTETTDVADAPVEAPAAPPQQNEPTPPSPQELIAAFQSVPPGRVTDGDLASVVSHPEAAASVTELTLGVEVSGMGYVHLAKMPNLASVTVKSPDSDAGSLSRLGEATSITTLVLAATQANDTVIRSLSKLPNLQSLDVSRTKITPASAAAFGQCGALRYVNLMGTMADDSIVGSLISQPIRELNLAKTRVTPACMSAILKMPELETLNMSFNGQIPGAAYRGISKTKLKSLAVGDVGSTFGLEGFKAIKGLRTLEELNVFNTGLVQHKDCIVFNTMPNLRVLNAGGNAIGNEGMLRFFKGHKSLEYLNLGSNKNLGNQGLAALVGVKTLKEVNIINTQCNSQGAQALKAKLPDCKIISDDGVF